MKNVLIELKEKRIQKGITLDEISEMAKIDCAVIDCFENGKIKKIDNNFFILVNAYSKYLGIDAKYVIDNMPKYNNLAKYVKIPEFSIPAPEMILALLSIIASVMFFSIDNSFSSEKTYIIDCRNF